MFKASTCLFTASLIAALTFAPFADAASPRSSLMRGSRSGLNASSVRRGPSGFRPGGSFRGESPFRGISRMQNSRSVFGNQSPFGRSQSGSNPFDRGSFGSLLQNAGRHSRDNYRDGYRGGYYNAYQRETDSMARAYRDVGIANALVGLVGVLATASQQQGYACAPASPQGYWQRQAVVVEPQRYEQYQEWIPELYDSRTGQKIGGGYYEVRTQLVPEVVEYRAVWLSR